MSANSVFLWRGLALCLSAALLIQLFSQDTLAASDIPDRQGVYLAPGWGKLSFEAPPAGSYELPIIDIAADGDVLTSAGKATNLGKLLGDKITLLSFIYRTCDDVNGCPLSTMVLYTVGNKLAKETALRDKLKMITLSFDPEFDTPQVMREYGESIIGGAELDWQFLTTKSEREIIPILQAYQQSVIADKGPRGERKKFSHILRVYLIDQQKQVRNIYSLSFLHPDILVNDVKTLILEQTRKPLVKGITE